MRKTSSGLRYEDYIKRILEENTNLRIKVRQNIGNKRSGGKHIIDMVINERNLVSLKHQFTQGTAEEKIPYEMLKLQHAVEDYDFDVATLVLGGDRASWTLLDYYLSDEYGRYVNCPDVVVLSHDSFLQHHLGPDYIEKIETTETRLELMKKWFISDELG